MIESDTEVRTFEDFRWYLEKMFNLIGVTYFNGRPSHHPYMMSLLFIISMVAMNFGGISEFFYLYMHYGSLKDYFEVVALLTYIMFSLLTAVKLSKIYSERQILAKLLKDIEEMYPDRKEQMAHLCQRKIAKHFAFYRFALTAYLSITYTSLTMNSFMPFFASAYEHLVQGKTFVKRLPFLMYFPFDIESSYLGYTIAYICETYIGCSTVTAILACDVLFSYLIIHICVQFTIIAAKLENFRPSDYWQDMRELCEIVEHHERVMRMADGVNVIFRISVFLNFLSSTGIICFVGFLAKEGGTLIDLSKYTALMSFEIFQVLLISYLGNSLKENSLLVGDAVFEQNWLNADIRYKRMLCIIIQRCQQPSVVKGITNAPVDLGDFKNVISMSYQFFAVINTMYKREA